MAGLFYLPRIFVHHQEGSNAGEDVRRLVTMAKNYSFFERHDGAGNRPRHGAMARLRV